MTATRTATHLRTTRSPRLTPRARKAWLTAHIASSVGWLGAAYTMLVLGSAALISDQTEFRVALYEVMHLFDRAVNIPLAALMLPTRAATGSTEWEIVTISVCTMLTLTAITTISVFKPWGRTHWARRPE
ncbi:MAG: hypothetical protein ACRDTF_18115 [Pseudonocardiaceae bacterium]